MPKAGTLAGGRAAVMPEERFITPAPPVTTGFEGGRVTTPEWTEDRLAAEAERLAKGTGALGAEAERWTGRLRRGKGMPAAP